MVTEGAYYFDTETLGVVRVAEVLSDPLVLAEWVGWVSEDRELYMRAVPLEDLARPEIYDLLPRFRSHGPVELKDAIDPERLVVEDADLPDETMADITLHILDMAG